MHEVIVIGGGILGSFAAYFLARSGRRVALIERGDLGGRASGANPGGLNPFHGPGLPGPLSPLAERSFALHLEHWERIGALSGMAFHAHRVSRVELAWDATERQALVDAARHYNVLPGFSARWMERCELLQRSPRIHSGVVGGLWTEGNGMVSSLDYTRAVARAAEVLGATLIRGEVTSLVTKGRRVTGVATRDGTLPCVAVLLATGAWMADAAAWLGVAIPVTPLKGELLLAEMPGGRLDHHLTWKTTGVYQTPQGPVWLGGTQEPVGFDEQPTVAGREAILQAAARLVPEAGRARVVHHVAALRPMSPDGLPLLGQLHRWDNAFLAGGAGQKGMLLSAGMGESVARLMAGESPGISMDLFRPDRFASASTTGRP